MSSTTDSAAAVGREAPGSGGLRGYLESVRRSQAEVPLSSLGPTTIILLAMAAALYLAQAALMVIVGRHLFNDGAWFVVKMLSENHVALWNAHGWHDFFVGRYGSFLYQEYPTLLASRLHVRNPRTLILIYGATLYSFKPLGILLCYRWARDKRLLIFPVLTLVAVSMNSEGYLVTETHLMTALFWAALFGLMLREEFNTFDLVAMIVVSAPLLLCYETMAAFGVFLCAACVYRYLAIAKSRRERWLCSILFVWYTLTIIFAVLAIIYPRDPTNRNGFLSGMLFMFHVDHIGAQISCIVLVLCALIVLVPERFRTVINLLTAAAILCSLDIPLYILRHPERTHLGSHVVARTMNGTVPLAFALVFMVLVFHLLKVGTFQYKRLFMIAAVLGMCQSAWSVMASVQWSDMTMVLRSELRTHTGALPYEESLLSQWSLDGQPIRTLTAEWPMPALSILYSDHRVVKSMIVPSPGTYSAFNPYSASTLPDLRRFGIDYRPYLAALPSNRPYPLDEWISFADQGDTVIQRGRGWWNTEAWGTWSSDEAAVTVNMPEPAKTDLMLQAVVTGFVNPKNPDVFVQVLVNNAAVGEWHFHYKPSTDPYEERDIVVSKEILNRQIPPVIRFLVSGAHTPLELGMGGDPRKLGLAMVKMRFIACTGDVCKNAATQAAHAAAGR